MNEPASDFLSELEWQVYHACARLQGGTLVEISKALQQTHEVDVRTVGIQLKRLTGNGLLRATLEPGTEKDEIVYFPALDLRDLLRMTLQGLRQAALQDDPEAIALFRELVREELPDEP